MHVFTFREKENVLLLGEGNFTFCHSLINYMKSLGSTNFSNLYATCFEDEQKSIILEAIKHDLINSGVKLVFAVDATKLSSNLRLKNVTFNKIIFNFPHVGGKMKIHMNRLLLQNFFIESFSFLAKGGEVIVTLCAGQGGTPADVVKRGWGNSWQIVEMAARAGLVLKDTTPFPYEFFNEYVSVGYRGGVKSFNTKDAVVHSFKMGIPLLMNITHLVYNISNLCLLDGVLMSHTHKTKITENPFLNSNSPQNHIFYILEHLSQLFDSNYTVISKIPPFTRLRHYPNQAPCVVGIDNCFLRHNLLHNISKINEKSLYIVKGIGFNDFTGVFSIAPAECHIALFGNTIKEIGSMFIRELQNIFKSYLNAKKINYLTIQNWFQVEDDAGKAIDFNVDKILECIFETNWRQLWCPGLKFDTEQITIIPPSLHFQSFTFDITFKTNNEVLDVTKLCIILQQISCDLIESAQLLNVYMPDESATVMNYCFRFVYNSYYSALSRKSAVAYHNVIGKTIQQIILVEIV